MIPKKIHYCWLGDAAYPEKIAYCIETWKQKLPDYEFVRWDKSRFDIHTVPWVEEAYEAKKYAFAADYIRCYALYSEGGIYLDSDVEVLKSYNDLLDRPYFIGHERFTDSIEAATLGFEAGHPLFRHMLDYYKDRHFVTESGYDTRPLPYIMREVIEQEHIELDIFPSDYFSPKLNEELHLSENTYSIHHYTGTWRNPLYNKLRLLTIRLLGARGKERIASLLKRLGKKY